MKLIRGFVFLIIVFCSPIIFGIATRFAIKDFAQEKVVVTKRVKSSHSLITFIKYHGSSFVIKQKLREHSNYWSVIQAILADVFAHSIETVLSQRARLIPGYVHFPTKLHKNTPASLLTVAPGKSIRQWNRTSPRQITSKTKRILKHLFLKQSSGMNVRILQSIARHPDLPHILAVHIILGFYDGHDGNIFYDQEKNRFAIIDMDSSFKKNLAQGSYAFIKKYCTQKRVTSDIKRALLTVADTLELLMQKNPIKKIKELARDITNAFNGENDGELLFKKRILQVEAFLKQSYTWADKLIFLIRNGREVLQIRSKRI
jgi:hypothetical protein